MIQRDVLQVRKRGQSMRRSVFSCDFQWIRPITPDERIQACPCEICVLKKHRKVICKLCHSNLRFKNVLLRHAADGVLDPRGSDRLTRESDLFVVQAQFVLLAQNVVEAASHTRRYVELLRLKLSLR